MCYFVYRRYNYHLQVCMAAMNRVGGVVKNVQYRLKNDMNEPYMKMIVTSARYLAYTLFGYYAANGAIRLGWLPSPRAWLDSRIKPDDLTREMFNNTEVIHLGGTRYVGLTQNQGIPLVEIRDYQKDSNGKLTIQQHYHGIYLPLASIKNLRSITSDLDRQFLSAQYAAGKGASK